MAQKMACKSTVPYLEAFFVRDRIFHVSFALDINRMWIIGATEPTQAEFRSTWYLVQPPMVKFYSYSHKQGYILCSM
jgi:hypothetical protein